MKIVILGSCKLAPYYVVAPNSISVVPDPRQILAFQLWQEGKQEESYEKAEKVFYPEISRADLVIVVYQDKIGEHTKRDALYAESLGKQVIYIKLEDKNCLKKKH